MEYCDVIIIGAGIAGVAAALADRLRIELLKEPSRRNPDKKIPDGRPPGIFTGQWFGYLSKACPAEPSTSIFLRL